MWHFSLNMDFSWRCGSFVVAPLTHRPGVPRTGSEGGDQPWWRMADGYHLGAHWGQGCCCVLVLPQTFFGPPKTEWSICQSPFFHIEILIWGNCTSFRQTQIPFKWILQLAWQIWRLSQQVGYVLFYATPAGRICPRGWRSWSKPHGMRTSWTWRVWAETIQARFKLYIVIWFNNVL